VPPNFVELRLELERIAREVAHFTEVLDRLDRASLGAGSQEAWEATQICASATEKIYSGCERVMARMAKLHAAGPFARLEGWHIALLQHMASPLPGVRDAVITPTCFELLDKLRAFRHRERNSYGFDLDFGIVFERGHEAVAAFRLFRQEIEDFLSRV
jgi:hypothetical protein